MRATIGGLRDEVVIFTSTTSFRLSGRDFGHGIERVVKFVFVNVDALLPRLFQLLEDPLGPVDLLGFAFQFHPAFARRNFHAERIFERLQEFEIVRVKRLHARVRSRTAACGFQSFRGEPKGR